jgi:hypothetical protein
LYRELQLEGIPLTVVTRFAAYAAKLPLSLYDKMAATKHPIGARMQKAQKHSLQHLWKRCCMPDGDPNREGLPGRCDKPWFSKVFLAGQGMDRTGEDSIWDLTGTFQAYDPMALLAALPGVRDRFLTPYMVAVEDRSGEVTFHEVVGLSEAVTGVQPGAPLDDWLHLALCSGLALSGPSLDVRKAFQDSDLHVLENGHDSLSQSQGETGGKSGPLSASGKSGPLSASDDKTTTADRSKRRKPTRSFTSASSGQIGRTFLIAKSKERVMHAAKLVTAALQGDLTV